MEHQVSNSPSAVTFSLQGRTAIVTGSGRNIGKAIALEFARHGANVVVNGHRDLAALEGTAKEIQDLGRGASPFIADIADPEAVSKMVAHASDTFGSVDIIVCNAAVRPHQAFLDISIEDWNRTLQTNLFSAFYLARSAIPLMIKGGWGRIINISGDDGYTGYPNRAHNVVCKAGVHALAKAIGKEYGRNGITANVVAPGWINTERDWSQYPNVDLKAESERIPVKRLGTVTDIAAACVYLASDSAGFISGQVIHANGGIHMF